MHKAETTLQLTDTIGLEEAVAVNGFTEFDNK
jgi:hypothetical protein